MSVDLRLSSLLSTSGSGLRGHACNCIGCCEKCGQCRTAPWHAGSCADVARLNAERAAVIEKAAKS